MDKAGTYLTEFQTKRLLGKFGISITHAEEVESAEEAVAAAERIGFPVALKISHPLIAHKSDQGGVFLNVQSKEEAFSAANRILSIKPGAKILVEEQALQGGVDFIAGFKKDPVFGPVIMVGLGGIFAEIFADTAIHVGDINERHALNLISQLKGRNIIEGARGATPADKEAVAKVLVALSDLCRENRDIAELDINPLRAYEKGALALDALAITSEVSEDMPEIKAEKREKSEGIEKFFRPKSVAVVGASAAAKKAGNIIIKNLIRFFFRVNK